MKKYFSFALLVVLGALVTAGGVLAATSKTSKQSALQNGTSVRTKTDTAGLYNQECYDAYYGCMDQFCIMDNESGGSCACSDESIALNKKLEEIKDILMEADRIKTEEVEKVQAGANADIIFNGKREYDKKTGDVKTASKEDSKAEKKKALLSLWDNEIDYDDVLGEDIEEDIGDKVGDDLYKSADKLCRQQMNDKCSGDVTLLKQMYSRQIVSDCKGFANSLNQKEQESKLAMSEAESAVRNAYKESFEAANKYDRGECMVEYKKCMRGPDACGENWENCVFTIATENMQNNKTQSVAGTKVATINNYDITASTMEMLESKRYICERVLDSCVAVRDNVWNDFLREAAPTIRLAETKIESQKRQSCLTDISNCIQKACKDDIVGKGTATMDACLARPDMARSFCKVEIDPCERMEPQIWDYVVDKLAAMRVDVCTQEVKDCFTDDTRCGKDFSKCIGMDFEYIHEMCPIDKLVVCKKANPDFKMEDIDSMLMGLYLNIDNSELENCQNLVDEKMLEVCGSTTDCNKFAADDTIGTGSLQSQKIGSVYRVTGMISFGSIKMGTASVKTTDGDDVLKPGEIGVADYLVNVKSRNMGVENANGIISSIEAELNNISGTINRVIEMIEQDPKIQFCVSGRNLEQITGKQGDKTQARFPNLLNQVKMQIAVAALRQAQDNYNAKFTEMVAEATKNSSLDVAQYMCNNIGNVDSKNVEDSTPLVAPFAISYDVGQGLNVADLTKGGASSFSNSNYTSKGAGGDTTIQTTSVFDRNTRNCHVCRVVTAKTCSVEGGNWFRTANTKCAEPIIKESCEDIPM